MHEKAVGLATHGAEGMAELQVERINRHLVTHRQDSHSGEVAGRVGDISSSCHSGQAQGRTWRTGSQCIN